MTLRAGPNPGEAIAELLGVAEMPELLAARTQDSIAEFLVTGDAIAASQLIHAAIVRRNRAHQP